MPKQENTAINDLIGLVSQRPIDADEPALFEGAPPAARPRPVPFGGSLAPIGAAVAPLPRRRAPAATPAQVPRQPIYADDDDDDSATTVSAPPQWVPLPSLGHVAASYTVEEPDTGPFAPEPLPTVPQVGYAYPQVQPAYQRPAYPPPHAPPAYYQAPYADHLETMRVHALPLEEAPSLGREVLATMLRFWIPFAALGVIAIALAGYRLVKDDEPVAAAEPVAPIVMAVAPAVEAPVAGKSQLAAAIVGERLDVEPAAAPVVVAPVAVEPAAVVAVEPDPDAIPADSPWQPTKPQPTIAPRVETTATVAAADATPAIEPEVAAAPEVEAAPVARSSASKTKKERSQSRRAKRAAAKRAKSVAMAELAPAKPAKRAAAAGPLPREPKDTKVVAIAAAKPMKIGATTAAPTTGGAGKLTVASTPSTLIYVDGRNTGMMTPKTLSLPEGSHKITLLSPKDRIAKTISVEIEAGKSANVSKDFTK